MVKSIFITGTGTDVGKTYACGLLAKHLKDQNIDCGYYKPVLSGAIESPQGLIAGDCDFVIKTAGLKQDALESCTYLFKDAVSPHLASRNISVTIDENKIFDDYKKKVNDYLIVEGAGGITCPLRLDYLMSDLIKDLNLPIIIVADSGLGMINSLLLTIEYARTRNIKISGIILNNFIYNNDMYEDNLKTVETLTKVPVIGIIERNNNKIDFKIDNILEVFE